ncbi:hypothetical protein NDU88_005478 [Pleurodeles waltl]|uniref:Uncharacterized protein n=1 Tax=Pleurodeles waltl TaxID=8319 RepID=A0AAV7SLW4_PLEWA|nr:hypothetical protein NDU88_005478 [Pleurodeles waltl]
MAWDARRRIQTYHEEQPLRNLLPQTGSCREAVTARAAPPCIGGSPRGNQVNTRRAKENQSVQEEEGHQKQQHAQGPGQWCHRK